MATDDWVCDECGFVAHHPGEAREHECPPKKKRARIFHDPDGSDPREWDNTGRIVTWHKRYTLGDEQPDMTPGEWLADLAGEHVGANDPELIPGKHVARIIDKHFVMLPIYMYDHSGIALSTGPFGDPWDSGQVGFIYCTKKDAVDKCGSVEQAKENMRGEIRTYGQYINGEVFGFVLEEADVCDKGHEHWEKVDSCWGFYGSDPKENGMMEHMNEEWEPVLAAAEVVYP